MEAFPKTRIRWRMSNTSKGLEQAEAEVLQEVCKELGKVGWLLLEAYKQLDKEDSLDSKG